MENTFFFSHIKERVYDPIGKFENCFQKPFLIIFLKQILIKHFSYFILLEKQNYDIN